MMAASTGGPSPSSRSSSRRYVGTPTCSAGSGCGVAVLSETNQRCLVADLPGVDHQLQGPGGRRACAVLQPPLLHHRPGERNHPRERRCAHRPAGPAASSVWIAFSASLTCFDLLPLPQTPARASRDLSTWAFRAHSATLGWRAAWSGRRMGRTARWPTRRALRCASSGSQARTSSDVGTV